VNLPVTCRLQNQGGLRSTNSLACFAVFAIFHSTSEPANVMFTPYFLFVF